MPYRAGGIVNASINTPLAKYLVGMIKVPKLGAVSLFRSTSISLVSSTPTPLWELAGTLTRSFRSALSVPLCESVNVAVAPLATTPEMDRLAIPVTNSKPDAATPLAKVAFRNARFSVAPFNVLLVSKAGEEIATAGGSSSSTTLTCMLGKVIEVV